MGANVLGPRKTRGVARVTGLDIVHAVVWSHRDSGRDAHFTTADHRHGVLHRPTGVWAVGDPQPEDPDLWTCRRASCYRLFGKVNERARSAALISSLVNASWERT